ncbi:MAG: EAL domain-containing protein [Oscillospiraceae bacterium]|nr:EAL domain-containing protein [Oscillospiraceae bacterium]
MIFVGDIFALGLVAVLLIFYLDGKVINRFLPSTSKYFIACLIFTALTALIDLIAGYLLSLTHVPLWLNISVNTLYFIINIVTTSSFALYLFTRILEHTHERHCMTRAHIGLSVLFIGYMALVILNLWNGWLFYFDDAGSYCRGPLNVAGYIVTVLQMALVLICFFKNRKSAGRPMRRVLIQTFPVAVLCIIIQRMYPEIMLNGYIMSMVATVLFLTYQGQRQGVSTLTELNDRHRFFKQAENRIKRNLPFQVFMINIKNFGAINRKYGHLFGDEVLYQFAFAMERLFKNGSSFHMNGTVFAIILPYTDQSTAEKQAGILLDFLEAGIECMQQHIQPEYVVVDYIADEQEISAAEFYEKMEFAASKAYQQKHRYIRYTPEMGDELSRRRYLQERLQTVDREHGYEVWFQPVKCLSTGRFCSMEALIRLREPDGSMISPGEFIPLAEETGQIASVTWFVLSEVSRILQQTPALGDVSVSINLPMEQLLDKGFVPRLNSIVDRAGIAHRRICLEFTERAILDNFRQTMDIMEHLTRNGYRFFLDDFGSGYSNFNCLLQLPFQVIKLDACLLQSARENRESYSVIRTLTNMFHDMDLTVIAEGAETADEVAALTEQGVDRIQGYALARPMPLDKLIAFYSENPN